MRDIKVRCTTRPGLYGTSLIPPDKQTNNRSIFTLSSLSPHTYLTSARWGEITIFNLIYWPDCDLSAIVGCASSRRQRSIQRGPTLGPHSKYIIQLSPRFFLKFFKIAFRSISSAFSPLSKELLIRKFSRNIFSNNLPGLWITSFSSATS